MSLVLDHPQSGSFTTVDERFKSVGCLFFVVGAQKSGTTWLNKYLREHENAAVPLWKENNFWNMVEGYPDPGGMLIEQKRLREEKGLFQRIKEKATMSRSDARKQRGIALALAAADNPNPPYSAYADVLLESSTADTKAMGEACPAYAFLKPSTYAEMARLSDNVRFIFLMRDPVSRFISSVRHSLRKSVGATGIEGDSLSEAIHAHLSMSTNGRRPIGHSQYQRTLANLDAAVAPENLSLIFFEEMFEQDKIEELCAFLNIPYKPGKVDRVVHRGAGGEVEVSEDDRRVIANALSPAYDFMLARFDGNLPDKWLKSASLRNSVSG